MNVYSARRLLVILSTLAVIGVNGLASALPLNGQTTGEISDRFEVFFVPAGYVFSIWGLIYLGLLAYSAYQALPGQARNGDLRRIGYLYLLSSVANIAWIFLWHYEFFVLSVAAMLALLGVLVAIYLRLGIGHKRVPATFRWFVHLPFSIYLGWITVATIANITAALDFLAWSGWGIGPEVWTVIMLVAAVLVGAGASLLRGDTAFAAVLIWAFAGIAVKHSDTAIVATAAWGAAAVTAALLLAGAFRHRLQSQRAVLAT